MKIWSNLCRLLRGWTEALLTFGLTTFLGLDNSSLLLLIMTVTHPGEVTTEQAQDICTIYPGQPLKEQHVGGKNYDLEKGF